jgi:hypothetical protein
VAAPDNEGAFVLAFSLAANDEETLVIQLADLVDHRDSMSGMDTYSISTSSGATSYGGVVSARLEDSLLALHLNEAAAATLGLPSELGLELPDSESIGVVTAGLRRLGVSFRTE